MGSYGDGPGCDPFCEGGRACDGPVEGHVAPAAQIFRIFQIFSRRRRPYAKAELAPRLRYPRTDESHSETRLAGKLTEGEAELPGEGLTMNRQDRNTRALWASIAIGAAYLAFVDRLAGQMVNDILRGSIGVVLGLYICSHPAANAVSFLFFDRGGPRGVGSGWAGLGWVVLNVAVVLLGWLVITSGMTRFVRPGS